jgi:putative DNA primase/helicase
MELARKQYANERANEASNAAKRAEMIVSNAVIEPHAYLDSKGWRDTGLVWYPSEGVNLLVIPMRVAGVLSGVQLIDRCGNKKFLKGQRANGAEYVFGSRGLDVWCEGYATARSISECLSMAGMLVKVHACFSAGNLKRMAKSGFVVADNDASQTGENAAQATGLPYWMPDAVGTDFNDLHKEIGTFAAGMKLRKWWQKARNGARPEPGARETNAVRA